MIFYYFNPILIHKFSQVVSIKGKFFTRIGADDEPAALFPANKVQILKPAIVMFGVYYGEEESYFFRLFYRVGKVDKRHVIRLCLGVKLIMKSADRRYPVFAAIVQVGYGK